MLYVQVARHTSRIDETTLNGCLGCGTYWEVDRTRPTSLSIWSGNGEMMNQADQTPDPENLMLDVEREGTLAFRIPQPGLSVL